MKNLKTSPTSILIGKHVIVRRSNWNLKFKISKIEDSMVEGPVEFATPDCPYHTGEVYSVSINEIKYHSIIS